MEKRVILALVLSAAVLYTFQALFSPPPPAPAPSVTTAETPKPATKQAPAPGNTSTPEKSEGIVPAAAGDVQAEEAEEFVFETPLYTATLSNVGGVLHSYKLKAYTDGEGHPLELINTTASSKVGWPLALMTGDTALDQELAKAQFVGRRASDQLTLEFAANGVQASKVLRFDRENYKFDLQTAVRKDGNNVSHAVVWQGSFGDQSIPEDATKKNAVYQTDTAFKRANLRNLKDQEFITPRAGVDDQYFLAMFIEDSAVAVKVRKQEYPGADQKPVPTLSVSLVVPDGKTVQVYVGPKQRQWLSKADPQLEATLDYGWFGFIARPLVFCLLWIHSYIGNFGWSIVLLTVALNLVLFPLILKQQASMQKMQKIQPHMRRLQDQYKKLKPTDPKRAQVQAEMMGLYKEHGVNPMGGCLPLLLQMPFLFGFYSALAYSIELRRAPWIFWIKDLSQYDPYYVIPILMAVAMIVQQKMTPTGNVDPAQAKMMMVMPVMMTFMFLSYSSGLGLYWLTGSVIGVVRQVLLNKYWSPHADAKLTAKTKGKDPDG